MAGDLPVPGAPPTLVDSHCHLDFPEFENRIEAVREEMRANGISHALCISVNLAGLPGVLRLADSYPNFFATVGVHPDHAPPGEAGVRGEAGVPGEVDAAQLVELARHPKVVGIGETGLDYFRLKGDLEWQRTRFREHIRAARACAKPLVIHTREAAADTLRIMREEGAERAGGVLHCFTETQEVADAAMAMGFHISFSGIVTFKNARALQEVAKRVPLDRMLVETDSPYLAPVPFRGRPNQPGWVRHVAEEVARLRGISLEEVAEATTRNFFRLFHPPAET